MIRISGIAGGKPTMKTIILCYTFLASYLWHHTSYNILAILLPFSLCHVVDIRSWPFHWHQTHVLHRYQVLRIKWESTIFNTAILYIMSKMGKDHHGHQKKWNQIGINPGSMVIILPMLKKFLPAVVIWRLWALTPRQTD